MQAAGFAPGLLRSTTTRKDGFVNMVDVAPTILHLYGLDRPESMEGRQMESAASSDTLASRVSFLVDTNDDGLFRDSQVGPSMTTVLVIACVLAVGGALVDWLGTRTAKWARRSSWPLTILALGLIGYLDATYLAGPLHFGRHGGAAPYWCFVVAVAALLTAIFLAVARGKLVHAYSPGRDVVVLHVVDLVTGAHLEWNTVFGYSPTIGIRFVGEGNITFAQLAAAAVLFAGLFVWQVPTRTGVRIALGVLAVTVVVMGVPGWGNDFGAVLSALPGFVLLGWMLLGHRVRARSVAAIARVVVDGVVAVGLLDLLRSPDRHPRRQVLPEGRHRFRWSNAGDPPQGIREPVGPRPLGAARRDHRDGATRATWYAKPRSLRPVTARFPPRERPCSPSSWSRYSVSD